MSTKKQKNAPPATEKQPIEPEPQVVEDAPVFNREQIEKQFDKNPLLKSFKSYLAPVLDYMESVEARLQAADQNFQKIGVFLERMEPLVKLGEQVQQAQTNPQGTATPGGFNPASLLQLLPSLIGGGGGDSKLQELAMKSLEADISLSHTIKNAISSKILGREVSEIARAATGE